MSAIQKFYSTMEIMTKRVIILRKTYNLEQLDDVCTQEVRVTGNSETHIPTQTQNSHFEHGVIVNFKCGSGI